MKSLLADPSEELFLPSFCDVRLVFAVVVITELFAFVLAMVSPGMLGDPWGDLGLISLFLQWIALTSAAVLCVTRPFLTRFSAMAAALISYLIVLVVTALVSEAAFWVMVNTALLPETDPNEYAVFLIRNLTISTVIAALVLRYLYVQHQWRRRIETESSARIQALQARIRPHFLFNSMNTIASLTRLQPEVAEEAIHDLSDLFRASISNSHEDNTLEEEIILARRYLNIEELRLGGRLAVSWELEGLPLEVSVPPLTLQPLLENAIYHGIEPLPEGGSIYIEGVVEDGEVRITISNPIPTKPSGRSQGNQIALDNIRQRLQLTYPGKGRLEVRVANNYYRVTLCIPAVVAK